METATSQLIDLLKTQFSDIDFDSIATDYTKLSELILQLDFSIISEDDLDLINEYFETWKSLGNEAYNDQKTLNNLRNQLFESEMEMLIAKAKLEGKSAEEIQKLEEQKGGLNMDIGKEGESEGGLYKWDLSLHDTVHDGFKKAVLRMGNVKKKDNLDLILYLKVKSDEKTE